MIFGKNSFVTESGVNPYEGKNFGLEVQSETCVSEIFMEATQDLCVLESALFVADIVLEQHVLEGATNVEMMLEGVMGDMYSKLKDVINKLIAKLKEWYNKIKDFLTIVFTTGEKFIKKYETEIRKKAAIVRNFKYKIYNYNFAKIEEAGTKVADAAKPTSITSNNYNDDADARDKTVEALYSAAVKATGATGSYDDSLAGVKQAQYDALVGGDKTDIEEYEDFKKGPTVSKMMEFVKGGKKLISNIEKAHKKIESNLKQTIKAIEALEKADANGDKENNAKQAAWTTRVAKIDADIDMSAADVAARVAKEACKSCEGVLKKLLIFGGTKESTEFGTEEMSVLESVMRFV